MVFLICALVGPFGTYLDLATPQRFAFWAMVIGASALCGLISRMVVQRLVDATQETTFDAVLLVALTLLLAPCVWFIGRLFETQFMLNMISLPRIFFYVGSINLMIFCVRQVVLRGIGENPSSDEAQKTEPLRQPRLLRRIEDELRGEIVRLSSNGHHVEVTTTEGTAKFRMRLADAIEAMEPVEGFFCHRSHWVVRSAVAKVERENAHRLWVIMRNGDRVPVSRKYREQMKAQGYLS
ncbi:MAG: LytTR family DNA-binding domain-containing protein [Pseudomonadota bacterium]